MDIQDIFQNYENAICKIILYCIHELPFPLGMKRTVSVLKGTKSSFNIDYNLYNLATFSALRGFTNEELEIIIENLINSELLKIELVAGHLKLPALNLTKKGIDFLENRKDINIKFLEGFMDHEVIEFDEKDQKLFDNLKRLRRKIANEIGISPFIICGDIVLREITKQKPVDKETLLAVRGVGEKFCLIYGDRFLQVISNQSYKE